MSRRMVDVTCPACGHVSEEPMLTDACRFFYDCRGCGVRLKPKPAETFALGLHELVTNAIKYGALQQDGGRVDVRWTHTDGRIEFVWKESGVAPIGAPARNGLGTEILTRTLPYELTAVARLEIERDGARYELTMPDTVLTQNT